MWPNHCADCWVPWKWKQLFTLCVRSRILITYDTYVLVVILISIACQQISNIYIFNVAATARSTTDHCTNAQRSTSNHHVGQFTEFVTLATSAAIDSDSTKPGHQNDDIKWHYNTADIFRSRVAWSIYSGRFLSKSLMSTQIIVFVVHMYLILIFTHNSKTIKR